MRAVAFFRIRSILSWCCAPRPGENHHWSIVRRYFALLTKSRAALAVLVGTVVVALTAITAGYAAMNKSVTLSVDGKATEVSTLSNTVGEVLESEGVEIGEHDVVAPGLDSPVNEDTRIAVRIGRPLDLSVDGEDETYWVTATDVDQALDQLGMRFAGADLSASRGSSISREGLDLEIVTPKTLSVKIGDKKPSKVQVPALTVAEALNEVGVKVDKDDRVNRRGGAAVEDGDTIVVTRMHTSKREVTESIDFSTVQKADSGMYDDQTETVRSGSEGARNVVYEVTFRNGEMVSRDALRSSVTAEPVNAIVRYGTKERPAPEPAPTTSDFSSGSTVWDSLAQCESGGNWAINTGNGYYGGLQFNAETWQAYGGTGLPHENSRETQIAVATALRDANGGYGAWPACSSSLGLPQ